MKNTFRSTDFFFGISASLLFLVTVITVSSRFGGVMQLEVGISGGKITVIGEKALPYAKDMK
jgi:hypothetical protein